MLQSERRYLREEVILQTLADLGYATRAQLQKICNLAGDRNAARILLRMEKDKTIQSLRREFKVYYLTHRGKDQVGAHNVSPGHIDHALMRNDLYIKLGMPDDWKTEFEFFYNDAKERMIVDALFSRRSEWHFVEVDNKQTMKNNYNKIDRYKLVKKDIFEQFNHVPTVIFYTVSKNRKEKLEEYMEKVGVKGKVYV